MRILLLPALLALGAAATGCWIEPDRHAQPAPQTQTPNPTDPPPRVSIDTGKNLEAAPGGGVGLFVTYASGGNWKLQWTCDTNLVPAHRCNFEIAVGTHGIHEISAKPQNAVAEKDATSFRVSTITTTTIDSVDFRTDDGGAIALTMRIDGRVLPQMIWYVSDGKLTKAPSDPIELVPSTP